MLSVKLMFITLFIIYFYKTNNKDLYLFAILFSFFYFLPLYFGFVYISYGNSIIYKKINFVVYYIYIIFVSTMFIFHIINTKAKSKITYISITKIDTLRINKILVISFILLYIILIIFKSQYLFLDKTQFPEDNSWARYYTILKMILVYLLTLNYVLKDYAKIFILLPFLILTYVQNYRTYIMLFVVSIIIHELMVKGSKMLTIKNIIIAVIVIIFGFLGKTLVMLGRLNYNLFDMLIYIYDNNMLYESIIHSEPFITQYILNDTIILGLRLPVTYISRYFYKFLFLQPNKFTEVKSFYDVFINNYHEINYGVAYNLFSEPYAIFGIIGVIIFCILFGLIIFEINKNIKSDNVFKSTLCVSLGSIYTFFSYRNNIENLILWTQIMLLIYFMAILSNLVLKRKLLIKKKII